MPVGLDALEDLLAVVEHSGGRGQAEAAVGNDAVVAPPLALPPTGVSHVVGEGVTEVEARQDRFPFVVSDGRGVGGQGESTGERIGLRDGDLGGASQGGGCEVG